jgi:hypothetical protein
MPMSPEPARVEVLPAERTGAGMSVAIVIPSREELARIKDPSARLLACVEPATNALIRATALSEVDEIRGQAAGIERYARTVRLSTEAIGAAQTIARRAEVRMGQLLEPKAAPGPKPGSCRKPKTDGATLIAPAPQAEERSFPQGNDLSRKEKHDLRAMADHAPKVEEVLGEKAPNGQATRKAVLTAIKHESLNDTPQAKDGERASKQANVPKRLLALENAIKAVINLLQDPDISADDYGPNITRIQRLLPALEEAFG